MINDILSGLPKHSLKSEVSENITILDLFEAQAQRFPQAIALSFIPQANAVAQSVSYQQLDEQSNQLSHYLQTLGVGPEILVGICLERSIDMVIALLGVLKAGGAYIPLDPAHPKDRLAAIIDDAKAPVLLTYQCFAENLPKNWTHLVCLDYGADRTAILQGSTNPPQNTSKKSIAENLAYIIYTSGSTGKPKGVQIQQHSLTNLLLSMRQQPGFSAQDTLLAITTLSFDIAGLEIFLPLISGGKIILTSREVAADGIQLLALLESCGATMLQATPITWQILLEAGWQNKTHIKALCGGETLHHELAERILLHVDSLWNMYGPTETTIWSTIYRVTSGNHQRSATIPIGTAIAKTQTYILDHSLTPLPTGQPGDLYIGGAGVARGYLNRPALTADCFIPDPFSPLPGARLYKTGDLARYLPDGAIEFIGRADYQVKIHGFRIELGDIEAALIQHPAVKQAVVLARQDFVAEKRLVAYIVLQFDNAISARELRQHLIARLPRYMVPQIFVFLQEFPQTLNGKINRLALPAPTNEDLQITNDFAAPSSIAEQKLAELWAEVLQIESISIHDNFFDLGGHSLLATRLITKIRSSFAIELPLDSLFTTPTIASLADYIETIQWAGQPHLQQHTGDQDTQPHEQGEL